MHSNDYDVICIQETWFYDQILDNEITASTEYDIFRFDRLHSSNPTKNGGGVCTLSQP